MSARRRVLCRRVVQALAGLANLRPCSAQAGGERAGGERPSHSTPVGVTSFAEGGRNPGFTTRSPSAGTATDINRAIGELVKSGKIPTGIQQALDAVRVIGNEAVHPGTINLNDEPDTAMSFFRLVDIIVDKAFTEPRVIAEAYGKLPPNKRAGIDDRDKKPNGQ